MASQLSDYREGGGQPTLNIHFHRIVPFLKAYFDKFTKISTARGVRHVFSVDYNDVLLLWSDQLKLEKALYYVLSNAYEYASDGGVVEMCIVDKDDSIRIEVNYSKKAVRDIEGTEKVFLENTGHKIFS
jgi:signal transduction histidine kinase